MRAGCVLLNLLPEKIVLLQLSEAGMRLLKGNRVVLRELLRWEEHVYESSVGLLLLLYGGRPFRTLGRQVAQNELPSVLTDESSLVRYAFGEEGLETGDADNVRVKLLHNTGHLLGDDRGHAVSGEHRVEGEDNWLVYLAHWFFLSLIALHLCFDYYQNKDSLNRPTPYQSAHGLGGVEKRHGVYNI